MTIATRVLKSFCSIALVAAFSLSLVSSFADADVVAATEPAVDAAISPANAAKPAVPPASPVALATSLPAAPAASAIARCHATRRVGAVTVDGKLDDAAWRAAPRNNGFSQRFPKEGARPSVETEFAVLFDDEALYVGVWAKDEPVLVKGLLTRRDQSSSSDKVMIGIDSYRDRRTAFVFGLNPASVQHDEIIFDDVSSDTSWDAVWSGASSIGANGWSAEFRIPLSQLRFSSENLQQWGLQVLRTVARTGEEISWSPWPRAQPQIVSRFGVVDGIERVKPGRRIELLPYVTAGVGSRPVEAGDPLNDSITPEGNLGLDAKYGISSSFSIAATINPDFGQVEADPSQVNLSANQLFFPEKRPFFLDGVEMFKMSLGQGDGNSETLFYSRRIGAAPQGEADGEFVEAPTSTTIYGATKISGKTRSGWSLGILDAVTAEEQASFIDGDGTRGSQVVEPLTNFAVAKLKRDLREGKTTISVSATAVNRALDGTGLEGELHDQAYTGGFELQHRFFKERVLLSAKLLGSYVHGSQEAIAETQQKTRHLYQRPGGHLTFDPTRTSLTGGAVVTDLGYRTTHWQGVMGVDMRSAGLEVNDLGFQNSADKFVHWGYASYRDDDPGDTFLNYRLNLNAYSERDLEPRLMSYGGNVNGGGLLKNHWSVWGGLELNRNLWQTTALRGGPALRRDNELATWWEVASDSRKAVSAGVNTFYTTTPATASYLGEVGFFAKVQAASNLEISASPSVSVGEDDAQYIDQVEDDQGELRYLVGRIRQISTSLTLRVSWTFSPHLSFQAYAQPFLATGKYAHYKEVTNASAHVPSARYSVLQPGEYAVMSDDTIVVDRTGDGAAEYSFEKPDFGVHEVRSTLVLRWEYRPGSSVFAIWSHGQFNSDYEGEFRFGRGLSRLGKAEAEDIVMIKANYWIGL
jgi:hypothetical protein